MEKIKLPAVITNGFLVEIGACSPGRWYFQSRWRGYCRLTGNVIRCVADEQVSHLYWVCRHVLDSARFSKDRQAVLQRRERLTALRRRRAALADQLCANLPEDIGADGESAAVRLVDHVFRGGLVDFVFENFEIPE